MLPPTRGGGRQLCSGVPALLPCSRGLQAPPVRNVRQPLSGVPLRLRPGSPAVNLPPWSSRQRGSGDLLLLSWREAAAHMSLSSCRWLSYPAQTDEYSLANASTAPLEAGCGLLARDEPLHAAWAPGSRRRGAQITSLPLGHSLRSANGLRACGLRSRGDARAGGLTTKAGIGTPSQTPAEASAERSSAAARGSKPSISSRLSPAFA